MLFTTTVFFLALFPRAFVQELCTKSVTKIKAIDAGQKDINRLVDSGSMSSFVEHSVESHENHHNADSHQHVVNGLEFALRLQWHFDL